MYLLLVWFNNMVINNSQNTKNEQLIFKHLYEHRILVKSNLYVGSLYSRMIPDLQQFAKVCCAGWAMFIALLQYKVIPVLEYVVVSMLTEDALHTMQIVHSSIAKAEPTVRL